MLSRKLIVCCKHALLDSIEEKAKSVLSIARVFAIVFSLFLFILATLIGITLEFQKNSVWKDKLVDSSNVSALHKERYLRKIYV